MQPADGDDTDGRRTRTHARALIGRLYLGVGRVTLVPGSPDPARLIVRIAEWKDLPSGYPTPFELGFPTETVATLHAAALNTHARAVRKWRSAVEQELGKRRLNPARRKELLTQLAELDGLSECVADLHRLLAEPSGVRHPLWLTATKEAELVGAYELLAGRVSVPSVDWLARLIVWIGGIAPCRRFLTTVREALSFPDEHAAREALGRFASIIAQAVERLEAIEPLPDHERREGRTGRRLRPRAECREVIRSSGVIPRIRRAFEELPESVCGPNRIVLPTRDSEIDFYLLRDRCALILKEIPPLPKWFHLARLAALILTDGGATAVAWSVVRHCERGLFEIEELRQQSGEPGYELLLGALGKITFNHPVFDRVRRLLHAGATIDEVNWWGNDLNEHLPPDADARALRPVRAVAEWCSRRGSALEAGDFARYWESAASPAGRVVAESLARFLGWLGDPSAQQVAEVGGLIRLLSLPAFRQSLVERLRRWGDPPPRTRLPDDCPEGLPAALVSLLRRLAYYQRSAGELARLPKSLRKPLEATARAEREVQHLRGLGGSIAPKQAERLRRLERRDGAIASSDSAAAKLTRQAREVTAIAALAAAKAIIRDELATWWKARFATDLELDRFRWEHLYHLMHWADGLIEGGRRLVDAIVVAHREHGPAYRVHLPHNRAWLDAAIAAGLDSEQWFQPPSVQRSLADGSVTIALATDPCDLFLMGSRFGTCLSLDDGCNRNAVIPNAADANKAVVYVFAADGTPLARKLVGIEGGRLIGFDLYCKRTTDDLASWVDAYCGAWAARAGLGLGDSGVPANLTGEFWYDDGTSPWLPAAHEAHRALRPERTDEPTPVVRSGEAALREALRSDDPTILEAHLDSHAALGHKTAATYWHIVRYPTRSRNRWDGVDREELFRHLAANGLTSGRADPRTWPAPPDDWDRFRSYSCRLIFDLVPPAPETVGAAGDLLNRMPAEPLEYYDTRFETADPPPAVGLLPFAKLLDVLRQFARWMPHIEHGCPVDARPIWAERLELSWRRTPNLAAALRALSDPLPRVREVLRLFCARVHVPELLRQLRRQKKNSATEAEAAEIGQILAIRSTAEQEPHRHDPARPFAERVADARQDAVLELGGSGAAWYFAFAAEERVAVPLEIRTRFALGLMVEVERSRNSMWLLLGWLATLPEHDLQPLWTASDPSCANAVPLGLQLLRSTDGPQHHATNAILIQALAHRDPAIRRAARSAFEAAGRCDRLLLLRMLDRAFPWIHPDTIEHLAVNLLAGITGPLPVPTPELSSG